MDLLKRFILIIIISAVVAGSLGAYALYKQRQRQRLARQTAKAPEISVTFVEGWSVRDIADHLNGLDLVSAPDFLTLERNFDYSEYEILSSKPKNADLEGFLFPDTYRILKPVATGTDQQSKTGEQLIKKMLNNFTAKFTSAMREQAKTQDLTVYEIVTLASIIEKETGRNATTAEAKQQLEQEREIVSGIFYNRLKSDMLLQSDATVNYITKKKTPAASAEDIAIDSPYNTYVNKGLPPGPICNPSLSSIMAALYPAKTDYYYFLHKQPSGEAVFSKTFEEHSASKAKYLR